MDVERSLLSTFNAVLSIMADVDRPILISIVSILNIVLGLLAIVAGIVLIADIGGVATELTNRIWEEIQEQGQTGDITKEDLFNAIKMLGFLPIFGGVVNAIIGIGMWLGWRIMWYIGVVVNVLELLLALATLIFGNFAALVTVIINGLIIYYLFRPGVKAFFSI